jgi:hypothetical protein
MEVAGWKTHRSFLEKTLSGLYRDSEGQSIPESALNEAFTAV